MQTQNNYPFSSAISGIQIKRIKTKWKKLPCLPKEVWKANNVYWAVFLPLGGRLSIAEVQSIEQSKKVGLQPVIIAVDNDALSAAAKHYVKLSPHVICDIAGKPTLINPINIKFNPPVTPSRTKTRVPLPILNEASNLPFLPKPLRQRVRRLAQSYRNLKSKTDNDDKEQELLTQFAKSVLSRIGFSSPIAKPTQILRRLEIAGFGGRRDHFFHSFQNYFLGLLAIGNLQDAYQAWREQSKLHWMVDPTDVWLLTTLYHDVGYGVQHAQDILSNTFCHDGMGNLTEKTLHEVLMLPTMQAASRELASLMCRLLHSSIAKTSWTAPTTSTRLSFKEKQMEETLRANYGDGHGVASALILHADLVRQVDKMQEPSKRDLLRQTVLLACSSIPFHDHQFRKALRNKIGSCLIPTDVMPFAATLAFVDSIQDDRRDMTQVKRAMRFLQKLLINPPNTVSAKTNRQALSQEDVLWKIVESRDVLCHLLQNQNGLRFFYPQWMVG